MPDLKFCIGRKLSRHLASLLVITIVGRWRANDAILLQDQISHGIRFKELSIRRELGLQSFVANEAREIPFVIVDRLGSKNRSGGAHTEIGENRVVTILPRVTQYPLYVRFSLIDR